MGGRAPEAHATTQPQPALVAASRCSGGGRGRRNPSHQPEARGKAPRGRDEQSAARVGGDFVRPLGHARDRGPIQRRRSGRRRRVGRHGAREQATGEAAATAPARRQRQPALAAIARRHRRGRVVWRPGGGPLVVPETAPCAESGIHLVPNAAANGQPGPRDVDPNQGARDRAKDSRRPVLQTTQPGHQGAAVLLGQSLHRRLDG